VRRSLRDAGVTAADVSAVSTTSQRHGIAIIGKSGETLYAAPNRDSRGRTEMDPKADAFAYGINGRWPSPIMAPYRIRWFARHQPQLLDNAAHILCLNDWVAYQLSSEAALADSAAAETLLVDVRTGGWSKELVRHFNVPPSLLPPIVPGGYAIGKVTHGAARVTGLRKGTPVIAGGGDSQCALLACRAISPGDVAIVAGTTVPVMGVMDKPLLNEASHCWTGIHVPPKRWVLESNGGNAGILFRWYRDQFGQPAGAKGNPYGDLVKATARIPPGAGGMKAFLGLPVMDQTKPYTLTKGFIYAPETPAIFETSITKAHYTRALLEYIAYVIRGNERQVRDGLGPSAQATVMCGGLARSSTILSIVASVLNRPVSRPETSEPAALGAAMCAAVGIGLHKSLAEAIEGMSQVRVAAMPEKGAAAQYDALYNRWRALADSLAAWG
jgi:autoinducer 2 (AI-2) kinase